jgi:hypothetical protein
MDGRHSARSAARVTPAEIAQAVASARGGYMELHRALSEFGEEKRLDLIAVCWIGRGDFDPSDFGRARDLANRRHRYRSAVYLLSAPRLAEDLERGLRLVLSTATIFRSDAVHRRPPMAGAVDSEIVVGEGAARQSSPAGLPAIADRPNHDTRRPAAEMRSARG